MVIKLTIYSKTSTIHMLSHSPGWQPFHTLGQFGDTQLLPFRTPTNLSASKSLVGVWKLLTQNVLLYPLSEHWSVVA